ncbi:MAG: acyl carrier protein [Flavobacteriales bacterium]
MPPEAAELALELCRYLQERILEKGVACAPDTLFSDLGIDSMAIIELVMYLERKHGIVLPEDALRQEHLRSAAALARCAVAVRNDTLTGSA